MSPFWGKLRKREKLIQRQNYSRHSVGMDNEATSQSLDKGFCAIFYAISLALGFTGQI